MCDCGATDCPVCYEQHEPEMSSEEVQDIDDNQPAPDPAWYVVHDDVEPVGWP